MMTEQDIGRIWTVVVILVSLTRSCDGLGETCTNICAIGEVCSRSGICECDSTTHYTVAGQYQTQCLPKVELGYSCTSGDACATEHAFCIGIGWSAGRKCLCGENYYATNTTQSLGGACRLKIPLFSNCENGYSKSDQCRDPNANCYITADCRCNSGYYTKTINGVVTCSANIALGASCSHASECSDKNAECSDDKCICKHLFYDSNDHLIDGGNCYSAAQLRVMNIHFTVNTTSMNVSWSPPAEGKDQNIDTYDVSWFRKNYSCGRSTSGRSLQTSFGDLTPGEVYRVTVGSIYKKIASSVHSAQVAVEQSTEPNPPTAFILTEEYLDAREKTIPLVWTAPSVGVVTGYEIQLLNRDNSVITTVQSSSTNTFVTDATLLDGFHYNVAIKSRSERFINSHAQMRYVWSKPLYFGIKTAVQVPDNPTNVMCGETSDTVIPVTWTAPTYPKGDLVKYHVHVYSSLNILLNVVSTSNITTSAHIGDLQPGTYYNFRVYTENEKYNSSLFGQTSSCQTKPRMSDEPQNLTISEVTSSAFKVSWSNPINSYSDELLGYVLQIKEGDLCVKEIKYKCSNCQGNFDKAILSRRLCDEGEKTEESKTKAELQTSTLSFSSNSFTPNTDYTILVAAVNGIGLGHHAQQTVRSKQESKQDAIIATQPIHMIVGIVGGGFAALVVTVIVIIYILRRRRNKAPKMNPEQSVGIENNTDMISTGEDIRLKVYENVIPENQGRLQTEGQKYNTVNISGCWTEKDYMLCSAPKPDNVNQFWSMAFAEEVDTIIMFADTTKGLRYWPSESNGPKKYRQIDVEVTYLSKHAAYTHMKIGISSRGTARIIDHIQCAPISTFSSDRFVDFVEFVRSKLKAGRILLHSSEDLGSVVPFVVLDTYWQQLTNDSLTERDAYSMLANIVKTRKDVLLSKEWFILTHDSVKPLVNRAYESVQSSEEIEQRDYASCE